MERIVIPFDGTTEVETLDVGTVTFISHERLRKYLEPIVDLDEDEKITGFIINDKGISIKIEGK